MSPLFGGRGEQQVAAPAEAGPRLFDQDAAMPSVPPLGETPAGPPVIGVPERPGTTVFAVDPTEPAAQTNRASRSAEARSGGRGRRIAMVAGGVLALGLAVFAAREILDDDSGNSGDEVPAAAAGEIPAEDVEVCPEGMYREGQGVNPFYSSQHAQGAEQPNGGGFLHVSPAERLTNNTELVDYLFGSAPGVSCDNAPTVATLEALRRDILGSGTGANGFESTDIDALMRHYVNRPGQALDANVDLARDYAFSARLNEEPVRGPMYMVVQMPTGNERIPVEVAYAPVAADFGENTLFEVKWTAFVNDADPDSVDSDQKIYIDAETGQIYVIKAVGGNVIQRLAQEVGGSDEGGTGDRNGESDGTDNGDCGGSNCGNHGPDGPGGDDCEPGDDCDNGGTTTTTTPPPPTSTTTPPPPTSTTTPPPPTTTTTTPPPPPTHPPATTIPDDVNQ